MLFWKRDRPWASSNERELRLPGHRNEFFTVHGFSNSAAIIAQANCTHCIMLQMLTDQLVVLGRIVPTR